jgi:hypothetical protein
MATNRAILVPFNHRSEFLTPHRFITSDPIVSRRPSTDCCLLISPRQAKSYHLSAPRHAGCAATGHFRLARYAMSMVQT